MNANSVSENSRRVAQAIVRKLSEMRPDDAAYFSRRFEAFSQRLTQKERAWDLAMQPYWTRTPKRTESSITILGLDVGRPLVVSYSSSSASRPALMKPNRPCDSSAMPAVKNSLWRLPPFFAPFPNCKAHKPLMVSRFPSGSVS